MPDPVKPGHPPLSDEDLARYGGPPELAYLPLVSMANELIAARRQLADRKAAAALAKIKERHAAIANALGVRGNEDWGDLIAEVARMRAQLDARPRLAMEHANHNRATRRLRDSKPVRDRAACEGDNDWLREATDDDVIDVVLKRAEDADAAEKAIDEIEQALRALLPRPIVYPPAKGKDLVAEAVEHVRRARTIGDAKTIAGLVAKLQLVREAVGATLQPDGSDDVVERARVLQTEVGNLRREATSRSSRLGAFADGAAEMQRTIDEVRAENARLAHDGYEKCQQLVKALGYAAGSIDWPRCLHLVRETITQRNTARERVGVLEDLYRDIRPNARGEELADARLTRALDVLAKLLRAVGDVDAPHVDERMRGPAREARALLTEHGR